jgi:CHAT domain-containing protein
MLEREVALSGKGSSQRLTELERRALTDQLPSRFIPARDALHTALDVVPLDTVVLAYFPLREHLVIWRAERGQPLRMIRVPAGGQRLGRLLAQFKQHVIEDTSAWQASSAELFRLLVDPVGPLPAGRTLAIVGADTLSSIPFEALGAAPTCLLIQDHPIVYVSSLMARISDTTPPSGAAQGVVVAGFNAQSLRRAEQEAQDVARLYGVSSITGSQATVAQILERLPAARRVHLSMHGMMDEANPYRSYLALTDDRLTVWQLFHAAARAELVVLSACDTRQARSSLAPVGRMRDFQSVTALIAAGGARRVVASLWKADDNVGHSVMTAFHRALVDDPADPARALQQAKRTLAVSPEYPPQLWANYTLSVRDLTVIRIGVP